MRIRPGSQFRDLIEVFTPDLLLEVGSWHGSSAITFLNHARELGLPTKIICVDTWLGSIEHWLDALPDSEWSRDSLGIVNGEPQFIESFRKNISDAGLEERVEIVRAPSDIALPYLEGVGRHVDVAYIDGDHAFRAVQRDIDLAGRLRGSDPCIISGDDWDWTEVRLAVLLASLKVRRTLWVKARMWILLPAGDARASQLRERDWRKVSVWGATWGSTQTSRRLRKTIRRVLRGTRQLFTRLR